MWGKIRLNRQADKCNTSYHPENSMSRVMHGGGCIMSWGCSSSTGNPQTKLRLVLKLIFRPDRGFRRTGKVTLEWFRSKEIFFFLLRALSSLILALAPTTKLISHALTSCRTRMLPPRCPWALALCWGNNKATNKRSRLKRALWIECQHSAPSVSVSTQGDHYAWSVQEAVHSQAFSSAAPSEECCPVDHMMSKKKICMRTPFISLQMNEMLRVQ